MIRQMTTMRIASDKEKEQRHEIPLILAIGKRAALMAAIGIGTRM